jgi:formate-dependent nitrite reductase membrane component NrfD
MIDASVDIAAVEFGSRMTLIINIILIIVYLWNATYTSKTARYSAMLLLKDSLALPFWLGVVAFGIIIPLAISASSYFIGEASAPLLIAAIVLHTLGAVALKYVLLKNGVHNPILPVTTSAYH